MKPTKEKTKEMFQREKFLSIVLENMDFFFFYLMTRETWIFTLFHGRKFIKRTRGDYMGI